MKIHNYKNNLLVNFYIRNNIYKNTVSKNSGILFLKIQTKIETEYIPFLKIATDLNSISNFRNGIEIRFYFRNGIEIRFYFRNGIQFRFYFRNGIQFRFYYRNGIQFRF